jgi:SsrA-binding protein
MPRRRGRNGAIESGPGQRRASVARNRRAKYDYELGEQFVAGLVLTGTEIKSVRQGDVSIANAYIRVDAREAWIHGMHVARYRPAADRNHEPNRPRKLLLNRRELLRIRVRTQQQGYTAVPVELLIQGRFAKLRFAVARGRKRWDKREAISRRESETRIRRLLKHGRP